MTHTSSHLARLSTAVAFCALVLPGLAFAGGGSASDGPTITVMRGVSECSQSVTVNHSTLNTDVRSDTLAHGGFDATRYPGLVHSDATTRARACEDVLPGSQVQSYQEHKYGSPGDNYMYSWDGSSWQLHGAKWSNNGLWSLSCVIPEECPPPPMCTCPSGYVVQGGECAPAVQCPSGQVFKDGHCVVPESSCLSGQVYQDGQCVTPQVSCPDGLVYQSGQCMVPGNTCPDGYAVVEGGCLSAEGTVYWFTGSLGSCTPVLACAGDNFFERTASCQTISQTCTYGCAAGACNVGGSLTVTPTLVRPGATVSVKWSLIEQPGVPSVPVTLCKVFTDTGTDTWTGKTGDVSSSPITEQTRFSFTCDGVELGSATVQVIPQWQER